MMLTIGSRGSKLAVWQANWVRQRLAEAGIAAQIRIIATTGDRLSAPRRAPAESKGLFIKEIEGALIAGEISLAVHSLKDLPLELPEGLALAAIPAREDARDALISRGNARLADLPEGARIGTGSPRRQAQLLHLRPDLAIMPVRGNVDTRLGKLDRGDYDALLMASAGLHRLGFKDRISEYFAPDQICSAPGQGALAIEVREGDDGLAAALRYLDDPATRVATRAERAVLLHLGGGCQTPIAAYAQVLGGSIEILGAVASPDGSRIVRARATEPVSDPDGAGSRLAASLIKRGARDLLA